MNDNDEFWQVKFLQDDLDEARKINESLQAKLAVAREALEYYASYMDGDNPEFTKGGWQKYPDPKIAKKALKELE